MEEPAKKEFIPWADLVRVVATYLVVMVHVSGQITNAWGKVPRLDWQIANVYGSIARICVPLFFMVSGYLLLPRQESLRAFLTQRLPKVLIPFLAWSLLYLGWYCGHHPGTCTPSFVQSLLFVRGTYFHLWFLYSLVGIYLILPVLRLLVEPATNRRILWYLIGLWLIFQPILTLVKQALGFGTSLHVPLTTGFIGFFLLGSLLGCWTLSRVKIVLAALAWVLGTLITIIGTYLITRSQGQFDGFFYDLLSLNVTIASAAAFLLLRSIAESKFFAPPRFRQWTRWLASGSFGIYLIHVLIIEILQRSIPRFPFDAFMGSPVWSVPLVSGVVFAVSVLIVHAMQQVPVLNRIVP